jgi:hypothetical protein
LSIEGVWKFLEGVRSLIEGVGTFLEGVLNVIEVNEKFIGINLRFIVARIIRFYVDLADFEQKPDKNVSFLYKF